MILCSHKNELVNLSHRFFIKTDPCEQVVDFRAQQCQHLFEVVSMDILAVDLQLEQEGLNLDEKMSAPILSYLAF